MDRPKLYWDDRRDQPNEIVGYFNCARCGEELPANQSMEMFSRTQTGITETGAVQVWCNRHDLNVLIMSARPRAGLTYGPPMDEESASDRG